MCVARCIIQTQQNEGASDQAIQSPRSTCFGCRPAQHHTQTHSSRCTVWILDIKCLNLGLDPWFVPVEVDSTRPRWRTSCLYMDICFKLDPKQPSTVFFITILHWFIVLQFSPVWVSCLRPIVVLWWLVRWSSTSASELQLATCRRGSTKVSIRCPTLVTRSVVSYFRNVISYFISIHFFPPAIHNIGTQDIVFSLNYVVKEPLVIQ